MLKSLCLGAICLISHACTFNSVSNSDVDNNNSEYLHLSRVNEVSRNNRVFGTFNLDDDFDISNLIGNPNVTTSVEYTYDYSSYNVPVWFSDGDDWQYCYLQEMSFTIVDYDYISLYIECRDTNGDTLYTTFSISDSSDYSTQGCEYLIIEFRDTYVFDTSYFVVFDNLFTQEDNSYVTTYNGYYNFVANSLGGNFGVFGNLNFNNSIYLDMYCNGSNYVSFVYWNVETQEYNLWHCNYPFNSDIFQRNILMNGCKIANNSKTVLNNVGSFAYVRDSSYDDTDFRDLLLTIADVPVYFLTQLLNFELFGFNLFFACASLITLLIVLFVIRKIY